MSYVTRAFVTTFEICFFKSFLLFIFFGAFGKYFFGGLEN